MGFWNRNWEKISSDTISGLSVKVIASIVLLTLGIIVIPKAVPKFISLPTDNEITKEIINLVYKICFLVYLFFLFCAPTILTTIFNWASGRTQDKFRERELDNENLQLENENLKLKNENLKLEIELQEKQSQPDNEA